MSRKRARPETRSAPHVEVDGTVHSAERQSRPLQPRSRLIEAQPASTRRERPYRCRWCARRFASPSELHGHERADHAAIPPSAGGRRARCSNCGVLTKVDMVSRKPRCSRCGLPVSLPPRPIQGRPPQQASKLMACPVCGVAVPDSRVRAHVEKLHPAPRPQPVVLPEGHVSCSICGVDIRRDRVDKHRQKVHSRISTGPPRSRPARSPRAGASPRRGV